MKTGLTLGVFLVVLVTAYFKSYFLADLNRVKEQVDKYISPKETFYLVSDANLQWLKRSVSKKSEEVQGKDLDRVSEQKADDGGAYRKSHGKLGCDDYCSRP